MVATVAHAVTQIAAQVAHLMAFIPGTLFPPPM
jgi:hypothetical protein